MAVTLGNIQSRLPVLQVQCPRCDRYGKYRVAALIEKYGADYNLAELAGELAKGCDRIPPDAFARCSPYFPDLVEWHRDRA